MRSTTFRGAALLVGLLLAIPIVWAYATRLADAPIYLHHDEVLVALNAHAIATTGRDPAGNRLPLYFHVIGNLWQTPINIYATALFFMLMPVSDTAIRLPSVVVGLLTVVLMYLVAKQILKRELLAVIAAGLLALTPALFIHSRLGFDHHYPALFVTAWLLCLTRYVERRRLTTLFAGTAILGIGLYSYFASLLLMPVFFVLTCVVLIELSGRSPRPYLVAALGFAIPLLLVVPWLATHPSQLSENIKMYSLYDATRFGPLQGLRELLSYTSLTERVSVYYTYFNPSFLFFGGDASLVHSTRQVGVFLFPIAVLLPLGLYHIATARPTRFNALLVLGFLASPLAGALVAEYYRISRALVMLPFAILIATFGVEFCLNAPNRAWRVVGVCLLALTPIQFAVFWRDYMTGYRARSAGWFEENKRGAIEAVIAHEPVQSPRPIYLASDIPWGHSYLKLYLIEHGREDLFEQVRIFDPKHDALPAVPPGSFVISGVGEHQETARVKSDGFRTVALMTEPNGTVSFAVLEK